MVDQVHHFAAELSTTASVGPVRNLRVADSTIMPRIVSVPTMPACVLIGLRLVEILSAHHRHHHSADR